MLERILTEGKRRLKEEPFDAGHDYDHHLSVILNCVYIIRKEKKIKLEPDSLGALKIAGWWHDYKRGDEVENDRILRGAMRVYGYKDDYIEKVLSIKNSHSFGTKQTSVESQILFDADKLEYLSVRRYKNITKAINDGKMSLDTLSKYK